MNENRRSSHGRCRKFNNFMALDFDIPAINANNLNYAMMTKYLPNESDTIVGKGRIRNKDVIHVLKSNRFSLHIIKEILPPCALSTEWPLHP